MRKPYYCVDMGVPAAPGSWITIGVTSYFALGEEEAMLNYIWSYLDNDPDLDGDIRCLLN